MRQRGIQRFIEANIKNSKIVGHRAETKINLQCRMQEINGIVKRIKRTFFPSCDINTFPVPVRGMTNFT